MRPMRPLRVVAAPDSFGGAIDSVAAAAAIRSGWAAVRPDDEIIERPMADGGEGTLRAIAAALPGDAELRRTGTLDPLGRPIEAEWLLLDGGLAAFVELSAASGLALMAPGERDVRRASTRGTGRLIRAALDAGVQRLTIGLGGSATNDGGAGLLAELGVRLLDADGRDLPDGGAALARCARVEHGGLDRRLANVEIVVANDVTNPLCGPLGASATYGPQKGADDTAVAELDAALDRFADALETATGRTVRNVPGAGAAGGTAAGLLAVTSASLRPGAEVVAELIGLREAVGNADLVITGEGRADAQTRNGKTAWHVGQFAHAAGAPVVLLCGAIGEGADVLTGEGGLDLVQSIADRPMSVEESISRTEELLEAAAERLARSVDIGPTNLRASEPGIRRLIESVARIAPK